MIFVILIIFIIVCYINYFFTTNKENKRTIFLQELSNIEKQIAEQPQIYIPSIFKRLKHVISKIDDNSDFWQQNPQQSILNILGDFCYREIDFNPETKVYPGVLSLYGSQIKELYLFCVNFSFKKGFLTKEEYDMALTNLYLAIKDRNNA